MDKILLVNGPNINLIGKRQVEIYGAVSLEDMILNLKKLCLKSSCQLHCFQSAQEGELVHFLNEQYLSCANEIRGIIINAGAYTHTSIALRDALEVFCEKKIKIFEVHLSNIFQREEFRHKSYISSIATGVLCGLGVLGYEAALHGILQD